MKADDLVQALMPYVAQYGYVLVFLSVFLENSAMLGLFVPGETILIIAAFYAARGQLNLFAVMIVAFVGAVLGDNLGYYIGLKGGHPFVVKYGKYFFVKEERLESVKKYFERHGGKTIFIARFTSFLRALAAFTAGMSKMPYRQFFIYNALGAFVWSIVISLLGYFLGGNWPLLKKIIDRAGLGLVVIIIIAVTVYVLVKRWRLVGGKKE